ncbi:MAG TPA: DUF899 domain-containing protein [Solirubrobacteraceae bacterium]|nr:DUF899 domain-containing protein [Solirubrobacteraceae bacterium]
MSLPEIVSREEWVTARRDLLDKEKRFTRERDALNAERRRLPMAEVEKPYVFDGPDGSARLLDLFEGRSQLIVYHFMWLYDEDRACPSCSAFVDQIGHLAHLNARDTTFAAISRGPLAKIEAFKERMGWTFPWYSSAASDFNFDFHVTFDESVAPFEYNFRTKSEIEATGLPVGEWEQPFDLHGLSVFLRDGERVFHTYSTYARGTDGLGFVSTFLDLTPLGRQEEWEEPKGRASAFGAPAGSARVRYHDEY